MYEKANAPNIFVNTCETQAQNLAMRLKQLYRKSTKISIFRNKLLAPYVAFCRKFNLFHLNIRYRPHLISLPFSLSTAGQNLFCERPWLLGRTELPYRRQKTPRMRRELHSGCFAWPQFIPQTRPEYTETVEVRVPESIYFRAERGGNA